MSQEINKTKINTLKLLMHALILFAHPYDKFINTSQYQFTASLHDYFVFIK